ncbi:ABC transporter ATP-binding protein [Conservatibacter flavescens]|uniref:ABC transporter ATP-binding protein n=1 Tax=Conservatibacter flavescens TaxID=28161 RepID=A0A2M8S4H3_9PAST|nr:ABC transporter ATP-binding protein [Conservatibacter flavescens]PJG86037.1 ABC transporter ATP-binding protein [Conservatibacter flavescens]
MNVVDVKDLSLTYAQRPLFENLDFKLKQGEWAVLLGRSGVGKSSLLRAIAGLENEAITAGSIVIQPNFKIAWLAQQDGLYPWLNLIDNVQLVHHLNGTKNAETREQALKLLFQVGMQKHLHKPCYQLSGGQRQRVALARTLMQQADIILMDEPFSALDAVTRLQLQDLAGELLAEKSILLVTHDPQEAVRLGDRLYILQQKPPYLSLLTAFHQPRPRQWVAEQHQLQQQLIQQLMEDSL